MGESSSNPLQCPAVVDGGDSRQRRTARGRDNVLWMMETMVRVEKGLAKEPLKKNKGGGGMENLPMPPREYGLE